MLPLLSMTRPMLTGMSSRLKTESFCCALSSKTRKFSSLRPSAKRPRSSRTVVCRTTKFTLTEIGAPGPEFCPGGGGGGGVAGNGFCAKAAVANTQTADATSSDGVSRRRMLAPETKDAGLKTRATKALRLVAGCVVAGLVVYRERWQAAGGAELDFNLAPARVVRFVAWMISQDILISQLHADLGSDVRQIFQLFHRENAPTGQFRDFAEQGRPVALFQRAIAIADRIKDADGIELGVGFLHQALDIAFVVSTVIISPIRQDEQGAFGVVCTTHFAKAQVDRVQ